MIKTSFVLAADFLVRVVVGNFFMTDHLQRNHLLSNAIFVPMFNQLILPRTFTLGAITFWKNESLFALRELSVTKKPRQVVEAFILYAIETLCSAFKARKAFPATFISS